MGNLLCRLGRHAWRVLMPPEWQYVGIANYGGLMQCRRCLKSRWMTGKEEEPWLWPR